MLVAAIHNLTVEPIAVFQRWPGHAALASVRPNGSEHPVLDKLHLLEGADSALDRLGGDMGMSHAVVLSLA
jgi:hypothetical protein